MAANITEKKAMLKTVVTNVDTEGNIRKRSITLRDINSETTADNLYTLSTLVKGLVEGNLAGTVKITEEEIKEQA